MIAAIEAAEIRISVVEFDLGACLGWDDGDVNLAAVSKNSAAGTVAACGCATCDSGGVVRTLPRGAVLSGTLLGGIVAAGTFPSAS